MGEKEITIMKSVQCGMTTSIFNNWDLLGAFRSDLRERNIRSIIRKFIPDYVKKSLMEFRV